MCWRLPPLDLRPAFARPAHGASGAGESLGDTPFNLKTEVPSCFFAISEIFVVTKKTAQGPRALFLRRPSPRSSSPQSDSKTSKTPGIHAKVPGGAESFLKITGRQGFAHPCAQSFRWSFGFQVKRALCYFE